MIAIAAALIGIASVIDGDTLEIHGQRIRLAGVDAPESRQVCMLEGKPWRCGTAAANALSEWIGTQTVHCEDKGRDRYRRVVARCVVNGIEVNAWLVTNGWALDMQKYSGGKFKAIEEEARERGLGIHQSIYERPEDFRARRNPR